MPPAIKLSAKAHRLVTKLFAKSIFLFVLLVRLLNQIFNQEIKMKSYFLILSIIALFLFQPLKANACTCAYFPPCEAFGASTAVFIGRVIEGSEKVEIKQNSDASVINVAGNVRLEVLETFKGKLATEVTLSVASNINTSCGPYALTQGQIYLIYAYEDSAGLSTGVCTRTTILTSANEDLQFLRNLPAEGSGGRLIGRIWVSKSDPSITPLDGVTVLIQNGESQPFKVITDKEGKFELTGLKAGKYKVELIFPKFYESERSRQEITITDRGCTSIGFEAKLNGRVTGRAFDVNKRPATMMLILESINSQTRGMSIAGFSDKSRDGQFEITGIAPGKYILYYELQAEDSQNRQKYFYPGVRKQEEATVITVNLGQKLEGFDFQIPPEFVAQSVEGVASWSDGSPAAKVDIMLLCPKNPQSGGNVLEFAPEYATTDEQGRFNLQGFKGISYWIEARGKRTSPSQQGSQALHSPSRQLMIQEDMKDVKLVLSEQGFSAGCRESLKRSK
jgi:hypothetical protein